MRSQRLVPFAISASLFFIFVPQTPFAAQAALSEDKTTAVTISVDGVSSDLTRSWTEDGNARTAAFGGGGSLDDFVGDEGANELTTLFTTKTNGGISNALMRNMAQGGVEEITCTDESKAYYQRSQVTISNLPTDETKRVWAFYDGNVGSGDSIKTGAHFNDNGSDFANSRITAIVSLPTLCDGTTEYVQESDDSAPTAGTLNLGAGSGEASRITAGVYQDLLASADSVSFNVYVPMDASSSDATRIQLALGFVIDFTDEDKTDGSSLNDSTADVAIETSIYSKPWWQTPQGEGDPEHDEVHQLLPACSVPALPAPIDAPCVIQAETGVFDTDGDRLDSGATTGTSVALTWLGDADNFEARLELAPIDPISNNGFAIESGKVSRISVSWPTAGTHFGSSFGEEAGEIDFNLAIADTPVLINPAVAASDSNKWSVSTVSSRVITTLNGVARATSQGISRDTWWQQCDVGIGEDGTVSSNQCGADMTGSVTSGDMVFTTVPANLNMMVSANSAPLAGALVSTNGQGFAFGPETFNGTSFQFAVAGPSFTASGGSRSTDGFYYVCVPADFLSQSFDTNAADAVTNWNGTRDGSDSSTTFSTGTCGIGDTGLVGSLAQFGYSAPLFKLAPAPIAAPVVVYPPYFGPISRPLMKTPAKQGEESIISGFRMNTVEHVHSGDHQFKIISNTPSELVVLVPTGIHGLIDLTLSWKNEGETGNYTIPQALDIALEVEPQDIQTNSPKKLTTGSFKGFIAIYTKGYEGSKLSAKVAGKWLLVDSLDESWRGNDYSRTVRFTGAGYDIFVHLYIDGEYIRTDELTTK